MRIVHVIHSPQNEKRHLSQNKDHKIAHYFLDHFSLATITTMADSSPAASSNNARMMLEILRRRINFATVHLASTSMLDESATQQLAWILQNSAAEAYVALQREPTAAPTSASEDMQLNAEEEEQPSVERGTTLTDSYSMESLFASDDMMPLKPLQLPPTIVQDWNPLLFRHPFVIGRLLHVQSYNDTLASMCAVAVYNLGLALQCQSRRRDLKPSVRRRQEEQSEGFYQQAYRIMDELPSLNPDATLFYVYLAVCNNMAELLSSAANNNDNEEEAETWQQSLISALTSVPAADSCLVYRHFLNASDAYSADMTCFAQEDGEEEEEDQQVHPITTTSSWSTSTTISMET